MAIPSPLPLDDFERAIDSDPDVLGVFYFGSLGRGKATRYSDLDIFVWFADTVPMPAHDKLFELFGHFGQIQRPDVEHGAAYVGPTWTKVEIEGGLREELLPHYRYSGARVLKDTDGVLARMVAQCLPERIVETVESAYPIIHEAIEDQVFIARNNARGSVWSATGVIADRCRDTYELLGRLRGRRTYGYRYAEELLTPEEQAMLAAAWPTELTIEGNRRAALCLWTWTKHVWSEAEATIGQPLGLDVEEGGMLAAIDRMYERREL